MLVMVFETFYKTSEIWSLGNVPEIVTTWFNYNSIYFGQLSGLFNSVFIIYGTLPSKPVS